MISVFKPSTVSLVCAQSTHGNSSCLLQCKINSPLPAINSSLGILGNMVGAVDNIMRSPPTSVTRVRFVSVLMPHIRLVSISKFLYLDSFSATFTGVFLSDGTAMSINCRFSFRGL